MATAAAQAFISPAELAYLHSTLSLSPPIRPDGRSASQFRPLEAETGMLPGTNGSARVFFSDGTEAVVGVKAALEKTPDPYGTSEESRTQGGGGAGEDGGEEGQAHLKGRSEWLDLSIEIPDTRDDDAGTVFLASMLTEALLADGEFAKKLYINRRFHWKLYLDILLISPPLSYPLPLLSLTTHLALLSTRLPRLKSEGDEDPMFDDDWQSSTLLYPQDERATTSRPPITLLVIAVGGNIIFDPSKDELAVAESLLAVSVAEVPAKGKKEDGDVAMDGAVEENRQLRLLSVRTIDPPARMTSPGIPNSENPATNVSTPGKKAAPAPQAAASHAVQPGVWRPPIGGTKFGVLQAMIAKVLEKGGVADEILDALDGVELD
ncbi:exosome complex exonuclease RRP42 [Plectosphaerella cucumerina]|uniref:Ribosomal RNA-processing protein 42 n=1 Tax=Plectosphaerella cucumerina TaxID=40658 RepID=A0A8K0X528_9PEZI|nr:exosome complex exonuclease RRP42 [Plectosphaerella cucumerina]